MEWDPAVQPGIGDGHPLPVPGSDPHPVGHSKPHLTEETVESPVRREAHAGSASGPQKRTGGNTGTALWADSTTVRPIVPCLCLWGLVPG